jgi:hypothetical protein
MADGSESSWWRRTRLLAITVLATGAAATIGTMLVAHDDTPARGAAIAPLMPTLIVPLVVVGLVFWAAGRQRQIDNADGLYED